MIATASRAVARAAFFAGSFRGLRPSIGALRLLRCTLHFCNGSTAEVKTLYGDVAFASESRHWALMETRPSSLLG